MKSNSRVKFTYNLEHQLLADLCRAFHNFMFQWSFLLVFIALVTLTVGNARKVARRQKAEFHRRVADLGEEAALKSVMHGELPSWVSFPDKARISRKTGSVDSVAQQDLS